MLRKMIRFTRLIRNIHKRHAIVAHQKAFSTKQQFSSSTSSSSSSSDDEKKGRSGSRSAVNKAAREKLNKLLDNMLTENFASNTANLPKLDLAKPKSKRVKDRKEGNVESSRDSTITEPFDKQMRKAAQQIATVIGGDVKKTESELLQKLLATDVESKPSSSSSSPPKTLSELFAGMKIDRETTQPIDVSRARQVQNLMKQSRGRTMPETKAMGDKRRRRPPIPGKFPVDMTATDIESVDLFGSGTLDIFPSRDEMSAWPEQKKFNATWNALHEKELSFTVTHPPANYYQQLILWTQQGKVWQFPIDNQQGMDEERSVYFTEHIFIDRYIEDWCPPKGPIRHFMELVCVGLSKNHHLSVQRKKEHLEWYRNYFAEKQQLLKEVNAVPADFNFGTSQSIADK